MALFNKQKKGNENVIKAEENKEVSAEIKEQKAQYNLLAKRFTLLVENVYDVKDGEGIILSGNVSGSVSKNDKAYIIHPVLGDPIEVKVEQIEEGPMNIVESASDAKVEIKITEVTDKSMIPMYSVLSNIKPVNKPTVESSAESPFLLGLCSEYNRLIPEPAFQKVFTFAVFSARYFTPVNVEIDKSKTTPNRAVVKKGTKASMKLLPHPNNDKLRVLPVFTDLLELRKWKQAYDGNEVPQNFFMSFEQCADIGLQNDGYVINPFGKSPVYVTPENIKHVLAMKADLDKKIAASK